MTMKMTRGDVARQKLGQGISARSVKMCLILNQAQNFVRWHTNETMPKEITPHPPARKSAPSDLFAPAVPIRG